MTVATAGLEPDRVCVSCRAPVSTRFCSVCGADRGGLRLPLAQPSAEVTRLVHRLNLGAALLPGFWTFSHGAPVLGTLFWLCVFPLPPVSIGIMTYLLFNGNRMALQRRRFADAATFTRVQRAWTIRGLLALPLTLIALAIFLRIVVALAEQGNVKG